MTGPSLDLAALRKKAERGYLTVKPDVILAVLALVDEQRDRISTLEEALTMALALSPLPHTCEGGCKPCFDEWKRLDAVRDQFPALAGSPAENKEPS